MDLQKIKTYAQGILDEIATGTAPQPLPEPVPEPVPTPVPTPTPIPVPPVVGGAVAKDVADIIAKAKAGGKVIVRKGAMGPLALNGLKTAVTIEPEDPTDAASFSAITATGSSSVKMTGFKVIPTARAAMGSNQKYLIKTDAASQGLVFEDMLIMGRDDADDFDNWTAADWQAWAWSGVQFLGGNNIARRCKLVGVNFGLSTLAPQNYFDDNTIFGYSGDGIRLNGDRCEAVRNRITDGVLINSNHPDALQAFGKYNSTAKTYADLTGLVIEDNEFIEWTIRPSNPLRAKMQGIGGYNGRWVDAVVRKNRILSSSFTGMTLNNGVNATVTDNYFGHVDKVKADFPRVKVNGSGVTFERNQAPKFLMAVSASNTVAAF